MHPTLAKHSLAKIRQRISEGDCPTTPADSVEHLEEGTKIMKLGFCPSIGFILDFECVVECDVEFERGNPRLIVNDVLDSTGTVSILRAMDGDKFWREFALRIADEAERDELLIARAAEKAAFERAA